MKKLFISIVILVSGLFVYSQQSDILSAEVNGNYVTLNDIAAYRNCGADYEMIIDIDEHEIIWLQRDTGLCALCYCNFDLSVEIGPLEEGNYHTSVYYTESYTQDTFFIGNIEFEVTLPARGDSVEIINSYQSDCYHFTGIEANMNKANMISCFPNPAEGSTSFECKVSRKSQISIMNLLGQKVNEFELSDKGKYMINWDLTDFGGNKVNSGIYFYVLEIREEKIVGKLVVK